MQGVQKMKKRILAGFIFLCIIVMGLGFMSGAEELPLESIPAPSVYTYYTDSRAAGYIGMYSAAPSSILSVISECEQDRNAFKQKYGYDYVSLYIQYDWSVDSSSDWHYTSDWDCKDGQTVVASPLSAIASSLSVITKSDVLVLSDPAQKELFSEYIRTETSDNGYTLDYFDYAEHELYLRCRYVLGFTNIDAPDFSLNRYLTSDWSEVHQYSPENSIPVPKSPEAPVIADFQLNTDSQTQELTLTFDVQLSESFLQTAVDLSALTGREYTLVAQVRTNGGSWIDADISDATNPFAAGKRTVTLPNALNPDTLYVEFRMRYIFEANPEDSFTNNIKTPWSQTASYGTNTYYTTVELNTVNTAVADCTLCHNCSAPLGICLYIWLSIILFACIVLYIVIVLRVKLRPHSKDQTMGPL